jgi:type II secretory pathway pseudopilin PulG
MSHRSYSTDGFTIIEVLVVVSIAVVVGTIMLVNFSLQKSKTDLHAITQGVASGLRSAQNKTVSSENYSSYGVYFNSSATPNQYVLFKGATYSSRDTSADAVFKLPSTYEFSLVSIGGGNEVDFTSLTGVTTQAGSVGIWLKNDHTQTEAVYVNASGAVGFSSPVTPTDTNRTKDSRHVHFDYNRTIVFDTSPNPCTGEIISLYFDGVGTPQYTLPVCSAIVAGQIDWSGTFTIGGQSQVISIHTHHLNDAGYANKNQFSIHRDRRYNTKSLRITISGDNTGNLINYSADGSITTYSSSSVSNMAWQ